MPARAATFLCALALAAGCGSTPVAAPPGVGSSGGGTSLPAAKPAHSPPLRTQPAGRVVDGTLEQPQQPPRLSDGATVRLDPVRRRISIDRAGREISPSVAAGFGPTHVVVGDDDRIYVVDTAGGSVLLFRRGKRLKLVRRAALPGRPYAAAVDRERGRLWVTVTSTNEVVQLTADGAPRIKGRLPTVRQPNAVTIEGDRLTVLGRDEQVQVIDLD